MLPSAPRHFVPSLALPGVGLPSDRAARVAARRAFVALKHTFQDALENLQHEHADWLRHQVRAAEELNDLWLLRAPVFAALAGGGLERRTHRQALRRALDRMFPDSQPQVSSAFASF